MITFMLRTIILSAWLWAALGIDDANAACERLPLTDAGNAEAYAEFAELNPTPEDLRGEVEICVQSWGVRAFLRAGGLRAYHVYTAWWVVHEPFDPCEDFGPWYWWTCWDTTGAFSGHPPAAVIGRLGSALATRGGDARFTDWLTGYRPASGAQLTILLKEEGSLVPTEHYPSPVSSADRGRMLLGSPIISDGGEDSYPSGVTIGSATLTLE